MISFKNKKYILILSLFFVFSFAHKVEAAALYFNPSSGNFSVGNILTASVLVNTQSQAINNSSAIINFPAGLLEVISVSKSGSIFSLWVEEPAFSNSAGVISFDGGLPTPGFNGAAGKLLSVVFRVRNAGTASLIFSSGAVRANDGYGTDILQTKAQAQFNLISEEEPIAPPPVALGAPQAPSVSSPTHPDSNKWYAVSDAKFTWDLPGVTGARLLVSRIPNAIPTVTYVPAINSRELADLADGIWYFHTQLSNDAGWGSISHFRFQIDTGKPDRFKLELAPRKDLTDRRVKFIFDAHDEISGINHYEIEIDDRAKEIWVDNGSGVYATPSLPPGKHFLLARAVDKAGNFLEDSKTFTIEQAKFFKYSYFILDYLSVIIPLLAMLGLFLFLIWYIWHRYQVFKKRVRKEVREVGESVHQSFDLLRKDIKEQIGLLEKVESRRRLTNEEEKIVIFLKKNLDNAERIIGKEVQDVEKEVE